MNDFEKAKSYFLDGLLNLEQKKYESAEIDFENSLKLLSGRVSTITNLSAVKIKLKKFQEAKELANQAIALDQNNSQGYLNLGLIEQEGNRHQKAIHYFDKALELMPEYAEAWANKGVSLLQLKRPEEALKNFDKALELMPEYAEAWANKGVAFVHLKQSQDSLRYFEKALELMPEYAEAWANKGVAHIDLEQNAQALECINHALLLQPDNPETWNNKGVCLSSLKSYEDAIFAFENALKLNPSYEYLPGTLLQTKSQICQWDNYDHDRKNLCRQVAQGLHCVHPFPFLALSDSEELQLQAANIWAKSKHPENHALGPIVKRPKNQKIRIGYFSADFSNHPVSALTVEMFELHNRDQFEVFAFSLQPSDDSDLRRRLEYAFDQFIDVHEMSDQAIAQMSRDLNIDIAIDLGGYTANSRTSIFAYRAAPIQASYIGYLGSMGAEYMDYLIANKTIIPDKSRQYYSEKIIYLLSYQANDRKRAIGQTMFSRHDLGLPEEGFVFCCFNNNYKFNPTTFDSWMRILKAVNGSVLFLYADNPSAQLNLKKEALSRSIDPQRLIFGTRLPSAEYLARYKACDLFLDTLPYNAGTTASDALWAGLPVITQLGETFAGRVAASLLTALEMPELITHSSLEYENLAIEIAADPKKIEAIKIRLESNRPRATLFNTPLFTKQLETAYYEMITRYQNNLPPQNIYI